MPRESAYSPEVAITPAVQMDTSASLWLVDTSTYAGTQDLSSMPPALAGKAVNAPVAVGYTDPQLVVKALNAPTVAAYSEPTLSTAPYPAIYSSNDRVVVTESNVSTLTLRESGADTQLATVSGGNIRGVAYDEVNNHLFVCDRNGTIYRYNDDGTGQTALITGRADPYAIDVDPAGGKLYWTELSAGTLHSAALDGTGVTDLVTGLTDPGPLDVDVGAGKLYYLDKSSSTPDVRRCNFDGTSDELLFTITGQNQCYGLALVGSRIAWGSYGASGVFIADLNGANREALASIVGVQQIAYAAAEGIIYVPEINQGQLHGVIVAEKTTFALTDVGSYARGVSVKEIA